MPDSPPTVGDFEFVERHKVLTYPEYWFEIDEYRRGEDQLLLAHLRVLEWSPTILKRILHEWRVFRQCVTAPLFAFGEDDDDKWERFVSLLGFQPLNRDVVCANGETRRMFIHFVKDGNVRLLPAADPIPE